MKTLEQPTTTSVAATDGVPPVIAILVGYLYTNTVVYVYTVL